MYSENCRNRVEMFVCCLCDKSNTTYKTEYVSNRYHFNYRFLGIFRSDFALDTAEEDWESHVSHTPCLHNPDDTQTKICMIFPVRQINTFDAGPDIVLLLSAVSAPQSVRQSGSIIITLFSSSCKSWALCYMFQMNPLYGPKLSKAVLLLVSREWGDKVV